MVSGHTFAVWNTILTHFFFAVNTVSLKKSPDLDFFPDLALFSSPFPSPVPFNLIKT